MRCRLMICFMSPSAMGGVKKFPSKPTWKVVSTIWHWRSALVRSISMRVGWRVWSQWYIRGASFWEVDWAKSISYFSQVAPIAPNLRDASGWTASDRYRIALTRYGDQLLQAGDYRGAQQQYDAALALLPNPTVEPTATYAADQCASGASPETTPSPEDGNPPPTESAPTPTEIHSCPRMTNTPEPTATLSPYP